MKELRFDTEEAWLGALVERWTEVGVLSLRARGSFNVCLSGGSSPAAFYQALSKISWTWDATKLFIGDERRVPPDHQESNYRMIYEAFYPKRVSIERWQTESGDWEGAVRDYGRRMQAAVGDPPRFDLMLLGIGTDGHTASLFPGTRALQERERVTVVNAVPQLPSTRLTITYPVIENSREIWFLSKGAAKQPWIDKMTGGEDHSFPAGAVTCRQGEITIFNCTA